MAGNRWRRWWSASVTALLATGTEAQFSRLNSGSTCADYVIDDILTQTQCFDVAAPALGLGDKTTVPIDGLGFTGCVYNNEADIIMFGTSTDSGLTLSSWEYLCDGIASTTTTTTLTLTTMTTLTVTDNSGPGYSLLDYHETCADYLIADVLNASECFEEARPYLGLSDKLFLDISGLGFTGCVHNTANDYVFYSVTTNGEGRTDDFYKFICRGIATTTTTTTSTTSVTTSTTTTTSTTATSTTSTTSTSTISTSTSTETTLTLTTTTSTTSTRTSSTSTRTTTTYTGSSSTTTSTTETLTTGTFTTTVSITTFTETTSTVTVTTATTQTVTTVEGSSSDAGFVGDDPLTLFDGVMQKFWLPDGELVPLVRTRELQLLGSASRHRGEQWIDRLVVLGPLNEAVLRVQTRDDIASFKAGIGPSDAFETLNVTLDWLGLSLESMPPPEAYAYTWSTVVFAFGRVPNFKIGEAQAEMLVIEGTSARIVVMAVAAGGFSAEEAHLAAKFAHLDFVLHVKEKDTCEGVLPELWGIRPLSNGTLAMLETAT